ncbi:nitroreductase family protein [Vibrio rumoiensis]|uniref:Nitroreductase family protein n=1 Tax=Vibrio rumoiensis TaxID=76258 RepID=A0ABW7IRK2_9VIBR
MRNLIKKFIPERFIKQLRKKREQFQLFFIKLFSKNEFLSSIYYCFFSKSFYRQHQSVLLGRLNYLRDLGNTGESSVLLRRNIHRIEKGLIMEPRRDVFAESYIEETINCYVKSITTCNIEDQEIKWATDVLDEYFQAIQLDKSVLISRLYDTYLSHRASVPGCDSLEKSTPYQFKHRIRSKVSFEELTRLFEQRRSVRWYEKRVVEIELIEKAINIASLAPSACNRQPFQFHLATGTQAQEIASYAMGTSGFSHNIPALIVVTGDLSSYPFERDRNVIYIDAALATMQLMLAFETLGLSTCPINWPDIEVRELKMQSRLGLRKDERPVLLLSIGYGKVDGKIPFSQKKNSELLLKLID